ncbi:MAG: VCBS repeat-containing protein [Cyclobacteriaceae bacterium]|nr:VCBS repeat-containing protein [Cyclobacteriaceae bacterium]
MMKFVIESSGSSLKKVIFILISCTAWHLHAQVTFQGTPNISLPSTPQELAKGDFNNDGRIDFVSIQFNGLANQQVTILLNSGTGTFSGANKRNFPSATNPTDVAVGDFNEDGNLDVVTCSQSNDNFSLLLGDGAGNLAAPINFAAGDLPQGIAVGDMNKDGNLDVLVTNRGTPDDVYIYFGNGAGNFAAPTIITIANVWDITVADFNGDTNPDFAVYVSNTVQVWFGDGTGTTYSLGPTITSFGLSTNPIYAADLDGDGDIDILASSGYTLNDGSGNFSARNILSQTGSEYTVADLNKDTHPDIIANDNSQNTPNIRVFLGNGIGAFTLLAKFETRGYANGIEVADVDNDGNPDVVSIGAWGGVAYADVLLGDGTGYFTNAPIKISPP